MNAKKRKGYIYVEVEESVRVDVCDILEELDDDDLMDEVIDRKLISQKEYEKPIPSEGVQLRKLLCDILQVSYHSSDNNILDGIKERLL